MTWWDMRDTQWAHYRFNTPRTLSSTSVYWFDDETSGGGCRVPASWQLLYRDGNVWKTVESTDKFTTERDQWNQTKFHPITTTEVRLRVNLQDGFSGGILEWHAK